MENDIQKAYAVIETKRKIIGVKLALTKEEFDNYEAFELIAPLAYCVCVKSAMAGAALKFTAKNSGCLGSTTALGLEKPDKDFYDGSLGCSLGLYRDKSIAKSVAKKMQIIDKTIYGVVVKPLELFETAPDIVLIVTDTKNTMRLIQGYTYMYGMQPNFNMTGNQAVCIECTSYPLLTDTINISMFCSGTRYLAKWNNTEAMIGIPYHLFANIIEGVLQTVNAVEMNDRKHIIEEKLRDCGGDDFKIIYDKTYYTELERQGVEQRRKMKSNNHESK